MTVPEFFAFTEAAMVRQRKAFEVATLAAWQTARLMRTNPKKRLPTLKALFGEFAENATKRQSVQQMRGVLQSLSQQYGIPMRPVGARG